MKQATPTLNISLDITCPHCAYYVDIWTEYIYPTVTPTDGGSWSEAHKDFELEVECPFCHKEFIAKGVEY